MSMTPHVLKKYLVLRGGAVIGRAFAAASRAALCGDDEWREITDEQMQQFEAGMRFVPLPDGGFDVQPMPVESHAFLARDRRNRLLNASDKKMAEDSPLSDAERAAWRVYRQQLRDLPLQPGFPTAIKWPRSPDEPELPPPSDANDLAA